MNRLIVDGLDPFENALDRALAEIAFIVQLPPSLRQKAISRYQAVREYLETSAAKFIDKIEHFYPQGSMAIDATISTRGTDEDYDIDIVAQLGDRFRNMRPLDILQELHDALKDYRGLEVVQQTRCVTLNYSDGMHLDITPSLRQRATFERQSYITHAKGPRYRTDDDLIPMNAYGFGEWYKENTPIERRVEAAFQKRWRDQLVVKADAEVDDVPPQTDFVVKSTATLALQLLKRNRNIRYADRGGRMPPSVMLSYFAAEASVPGSSLTEALLRLCNRIITEISTASQWGRLLHVANPVYQDDVFTDRWPASLDDQKLFLSDLRELVRGIERAKRLEMSPTEFQDWLREMFGGRVVTKAIDRIADSLGTAKDKGAFGYSRRGGVLLPTAAISTPAIARPSDTVIKPTSHTFFGDRFDDE